jgi:hypothetical protein
MDVSRGFQIEQPNIFISWGISEAELEEVFSGLDLRRVTDGYFVTHCSSLGGLSHKLVFHFDPRVGGGLVELEFFGTLYPHIAASFRLFQQHLESTFGQPTVTVPSTEGFLSHTWRLKGGDVFHYVQEHFGPAEAVRIRRTV